MATSKTDTGFRGLYESFLNRKLTARDGIEESRRWRPMPEKLREFYRRVGQVDSINRGFNHLHRPWEIEAERGYSVFMVENQAVAVWAFRSEDSNETDPCIYQGLCLENGKVEWYREDFRCAEWLIGMAHWQIVNGACFRYHACVETRRNLRTQVEKHWKHRLTITSGPLEFYGKGGQLLCWCPKKSSGGILLAAGQSLADIRRIHQRMNIRWDFSDYDELNDNDC